MKRFYGLIFLVLSLIGISASGHSQTLMPLPPHSSVYSGIFARGLWFVAPVNFTITGLMVAPEAGTGQQYIHVIKCNDPFPVSTSGSTNFTTLTYISAAPNNTVQAVNIQVQQGDQIGILGTTTGVCNSYSASQIITSTIGGQQVFLNRLGYQGSIESGPAPTYWGSGNGTSGQIGRIYMYYTLAGATDAGLETFVFPSDTLCEGPNDVVVRLKNHGPDPLIEVDIEWSVNQVAQTPFTWTGNLAVNDTDDVIIGSYQFNTNTTYQLKAYTHEPNFTIDTLNNLNDTIVLAGPQIKPSPNITLSDTTLAICQGDTAWISVTLTGTPPWSFTIKEGTISHPFTGITSSSFNIPMTPATSRTYTIEGIIDGTGCEKAVGPSVAVSVQAAPPANITAMGPPAACLGDSVMLMGSVGLNFTYQWYHDGTLLPGATNYLLAAKTGGNYTVRVTSPIGCSNLSAPFTAYIHPLPNVFLGNDTVLLPHQAILLNAGAGFNSYLWSTGSTSASLLVDTTGVGLGVQTIWVHVTDNNSCKGGDTILINFTPQPAVEGIDTETTLNIFPNPTNGMVTLELSRFPLENITVEVYGADGKVAYSKQHTITGAHEQVALNLQHLPAGLYLLKIYGVESVLFHKILISR
jgi:hypothetical protein